MKTTVRRVGDLEEHVVGGRGEGERVKMGDERLERRGKRWGHAARPIQFRLHRQ
jgi:hypothetical protein